MLSGNPDSNNSGDAERLPSSEGRFTGRLIELMFYCWGKVARARTYAAKHNIDLSKSYFYSDSASDLPLLEVVGYPVAVNPNRKLAKIATERGWPTMKFY
jgi:phosphoserine phosphatase